MRPTDELTRRGAAGADRLDAARGRRGRAGAARGRRPGRAARADRDGDVALPAAALGRRSRRCGRCSATTAGARPTAIRQAAAVMGVTPAYLQSVASFYDLFATAPIGRHRVLVCHNISCWMNGADELLRAFCEAAGADLHDADHHGASSARRRVLRQGLRVPRRLRHRADGVDRRALLRPARRRRRAGGDRGAARRRRGAARQGARRAPAAGGPEPEPDPRVAEVERRSGA